MVVGDGQTKTYKCKGVCCSDMYIPYLCLQAALVALQETELQATDVKQEHFQKALASLPSSLNAKDLLAYKKLPGHTETEYLFK